MITIIVICALAGAVGIGSIYFLGKDNAVEKEAEVIIKDETGINVDLDKLSGDATAKQSASSVVADPKVQKKE